MQIATDRTIQAPVRVTTRGMVSPVPGGYRVQRLRSDSELCTLHDEWRALLAEAPGVTPFQTWQWVNSWWRYFGAEHELWVLLARDGEGRLAGLAPWMLLREGRGPLAVRRLTFIGRGLVSPVHLDLVACARERRAVARAFLEYLAAHSQEWDVLDLGDLDQSSPFGELVKESPARWRQLAGALTRISHLSPTFDEYASEKLGSAWREHIDRSRRELERARPGQLRFYRANDLAQLRGALDDMRGWERQRRQEGGDPGCFDDAAFLAFHKEIAALALFEGWLRLYILRVGDEIAGSVYGYLHNGVFYCYQTAFHAGWAQYGAGELALAYAIEQAIAEGATEWNMMRVDENYELSWSDDVRRDLHLVLTSSWRGRPWSWGSGLVAGARVAGRHALPQTLRHQLDRLVPAMREA